MLGGSWRQAGILAAGAIYAMNNHVKRLAEDHRNAKRLAEGLGALGLTVTNPVETNMVYFTHPDPEALLTRLEKQHVLMSLARPGVIRAVTHLDVDESEIEETITAIREVS